MKKVRKHIALLSKNLRPALAMGGCDEYTDEKDEKKCNKGKIPPV